MLYALARPLLFSLDPEKAHDLAIWGMRNLAGWIPCPGCRLDDPAEIMGLRFPNRIGLAAGLDKNGEIIEALDSFGFGHIEIGTVTPRPQPGNPRPRMFRLKESEAIINRMGFNNLGVDNLVALAKKARHKAVLGVSIGKNADTPLERAVDDYLACLEKVYPFASYIAANISSPNTRNLRQLQGESELDGLLAALKRRQTELADQHGHYVPLALKIAPDVDDAQLTNIADALRRHRIDGVIATNTTLAREAVAGERHATETGGLSGAPLRQRSTAIVRMLAEKLGGELPVIGAGGVMSGEDAREKIEAGASLVQLYTGFIYRGPGLVAECVRATRLPH
ncbi:MAG: dihydroorotate dehydrogenase (quinone) [Candidatus Dactylopiibacterium carminicum]|uniref:Dihydroorotate dehydrogenase (quinone) n=1 Tax=Candidatus Dactylopiibacterium carminicum TaxID=857335 RepID=A0A272EVH0_9RHOO|nr:quinone-dependent dihydroorotate dehydrogenase [Candidatus Dactylopiibacterium carminicum]KAF7598173.1 quinone-dependent dihydroorotate dehydrogenase [Candidatus Dactylopiibacterium carminicum]PAS94104.1 MAG: dihydroorotate dehydrogenase (quinone) [Candidatus Dactylopiibacterium carminicum]PAS96860.1 MAG: dihydroorotate dehydrogenase (quinone) [Candidatus Dactylopiibacterium carminicum]PAS98132.1 MAG: dihydroorotate dehydrogenase (quinone) [Candidatus Dactylopiibacterium carminicum]